MKLGSTGADVKALQKFLNQLDYHLVEDGVFGQGTKTAVESFQKAVGLSVDGIVGSQTLSALSKKINPATYSISSKGVDFIKSFEGFSLTSYDDGVGVWTIGWGSIKDLQGNPVRKGQTIDNNTATKLFKRDLQSFEEAVNRLVTVPLTQNQYDALVSFSYNVGIGALSGSTLLKKLNVGDYVGAAESFLSWNKGRIKGKLVEIKGLTRRRKAEKELFLTK